MSETFFERRPASGRSGLVIGNLDVRSVFRGLTVGGLQGKEIATMAGVAPSTVSKWRRGSVGPSEEVVQFLTLVLADIIQTKERALDNLEDAPLAWRLGRESELAAMRQALRDQERINSVFAGTAIRDGARLFKDWLYRKTPVAPLTAPKHYRVVA